MTWSANDGSATEVSVTVAPVVRTTRFDSGQGKKDLLAATARLQELAAGPALPPPEDRVPKPRGWNVLAVIGFSSVALGVVVAVIWWFHQNFYISYFGSMPLAYGFAFSILALRTPKVGLRGRRFAIAGVVIGGATYLAVLIVGIQLLVVFVPLITSVIG